MFDKQPAAAPNVVKRYPAPERLSVPEVEFKQLAPHESCDSGYVLFVQHTGWRSRGSGRLDPT